MPELKLSKETQDEITLWRNLSRYPAWKRVVSMLEERVKNADKAINTIGFDREKMFTERDISIIEKRAYEELIGFPNRMIEMLSGTGVEQIENDDPYEDQFEDDSL